MSLNVSVVASTTKWKVRQLLQNLSTNALDYLVPVPPQCDLPVDALVGCFTQSQHEALMLPAHWNLGVSITWSIILVCIVVTLLYCCRLLLA
jgi:hypothetical protein